MVWDVASKGGRTAGRATKRGWRDRLDGGAALWAALRRGWSDRSLYGVLQGVLIPYAAAARMPTVTDANCCSAT